jgi:hypothetical protein
MPVSDRLDLGNTFAFSRVGGDGVFPTNFVTHKRVTKSFRGWQMLLACFMGMTYPFPSDAQQEEELSRVGSSRDAFGNDSYDGQRLPSHHETGTDRGNS